MKTWFTQWKHEAMYIGAAFGAWVTDVIRWKKGAE
jgi:hypothetical protein